MRFEPGFVTSLREELASSPVRTRTNQEGGLTDDVLLQLVAKPEESFITHVEDVKESDLVSYADLGEDKLRLGYGAMMNNEVAFCVLTNSSALLRLSNGLTLLGMKAIQ